MNGIKIPMQIFALCIAAVTVLSGAATAGERFRYIEKTGDRVTHFDWEINGSNPVIITSSEPDKRFRNICLTDGSQMKWEFTGPSEHMVITRDGNTLRFSGTKDGKAVDKTEALDEDPWFQAASFSLRQWLKSGQDSIRFWIVRPDDLEIHKMKAERGEVQTVSIGGSQVRARPVRVRLSGAFALFWSISYWFRTGDDLLVRYEGVHGPPGTPKTVVLLDE